MIPVFRILHEDIWVISFVGMKKNFILYVDANYLIYNTVSKMKIDLLVKSNLW